MSKLYDENSIESLEPLAFTRLKPGVYVGDTEYSTQLLIEVLSNSIDEFCAGHGDKIAVYIDTKDSVYKVQDYGQGIIANSYREDGKTILEAAFSVLNTSGKYREDGSYEGTSLGAYGIGAKLANFLSHYLIAETCRDGVEEVVTFKEGVFDQRKVNEAIDKNIHGTYVCWKPSEEFFTHTSVDLTKIRDLLKTIVCLCDGLTIDLTIDDKLETYKSKNGLNDLVDEAVGNKEIIKNRFYLNFQEGKYKGNLILTYSSNYSCTIVPYVNTGLTESGQHITQLKIAITREFNKFFREKKWLKEKDDNLSGDDIQEGMYVVFNLTVPNVGYDAQIKSRIVQIDTKPFIQAFVAQLSAWLNSNKKEIKTIADKAINARKAREAAKKARESVRETQNKKRDKVLKFDSKLADCYSKQRQKCEIIIVEGDSAAGNLKAARDNEYQAVMPIRGKILNCEKASYEKIRKNAEIMTMIDAFGLKLDQSTMKLTYEEDDLRYGRIIIMSDADFDGAHIKNLFYTFIWNFCPQLILDGHVYAGVPPLYKIVTSKGYTYLKNDMELAAYDQANKGRKYEVRRMKGLGELSTEETEETLLNPDNRILKQITVSDIRGTDILFDQLMGTAIPPRKNFIARHSAEATYGV